MTHQQDREFRQLYEQDRIARESVEFRLRSEVAQLRRESGGLRAILSEVLKEGQITTELRRKAYVALGDGGQQNG